MGSMSEAEYLQLAGHITEKLDNTAEYENWLTIQDYVDELQSNLTKEQLAYINLKKTFDEQYNENQQLKSQLKQGNDVKEQAKKFVKEFQESFDCYDDVYKDMNILLDILNKRGGTDE